MQDIIVATVSAKSTRKSQAELLEELKAVPGFVSAALFVKDFSSTGRGMTFRYFVCTFDPKLTTVRRLEANAVPVLYGIKKSVGYHSDLT